MALFNDLKTADTAILAEIQGNILRGFSNLRMVFLLVRLPSDQTAARAWVQAQVLDPRSPLRVTRAVEQNAETAPGPLVNFFLTASGLDRLGAPSSTSSALDPAFVRGMRSGETLQITGDLAPDQWADCYKVPWDALLVVASDPEQQTDTEGRITAAIAGLPITHRKFGNVFDATGAPAATGATERFEAFGYRDGLSTPIFSDEHAAAAGVPPSPTWDPRRDLSVALAPDPFNPESFCSYFVFRDYKQDVAGFNRRVDEIAGVLRERGPLLNRLYGSKDTNAYGIFARGVTSPSHAQIVDFVKARIMGRSPDGTPLTPSGRFQNHDFNYAADKSAGMCPYSAHTRAMNPRGQLGDSALEKAVTIVRRGIGWVDPKTEGDRGLLFLCAQASIGRQFEFIQQRYANSAVLDRNHEPMPMADQMIGRLPPVVDNFGYESSRYRRFNETIEADFSIWDFVKFQGGEYLVAPSFTGLVNLVKGA